MFLLMLGRRTGFLPDSLSLSRSLSDSGCSSIVRLCVRTWLVYVWVCFERNQNMKAQTANTLCSGFIFTKIDGDKLEIMVIIMRVKFGYAAD